MLPELYKVSTKDKVDFMNHNFKFSFFNFLIVSIKNFYIMLMLLGASLLVYTTTIYWSFRTDVVFLLTKQDVVMNLVWRAVFYLHIFSGTLAIAITPLQLIKGWRKKYPGLHRKLGKVYVLAILLLAAPTGLYMAFFANGGILASIGFVAMSLLWFYTTYKLLTTVRKKLFEKHRNWAIRSCALTFSAVSLRLWVPLLSVCTSLDAHTIIVVTAWLSWAVNWVVAEGLIAFRTMNLRKGGVMNSV